MGDVILFGSYYAVCYGTRPMVADLLARADQAGAILYYDLNYRASHRDELDKLMPTILNNFMRTTIVRGSADDFEVMYGLRDAQKIYDRYVSDYCPYFICTAGAEPVTVCTPANTFRNSSLSISRTVLPIMKAYSKYSRRRFALLPVLRDPLPSTLRYFSSGS